MSDHKDDTPKRPQRTQVRKVANSRVPDPGARGRASGPQRTQVRRVRRHGSTDSGTQQDQGRDHYQQDRESSREARPREERGDARTRSSGYRRSGPQQVSEPAHRRAPRAPQHAPQAEWSSASVDRKDRRLLDEASSLLALGGYLKSSDRPNDLEQLRNEIIDAVGRYRDSIQEFYSVKTVEDASFCVCAFLDDCVLGSIWSKGSQWAQGSVLANVHGRADRSDLLPMLRRNLQEGADPDLIALYHTVLSLGFEGSEDNQAELSKLREQVYRELKQLGHEEQLRLVDDSMVVAETGERLADRIPWWTLLAAAAAVMLGLFVGIGWLQRSDMAAFNAKVDTLIDQHQRLALADFVPDAYVPPAPQRLNLSALLAEDIANNRVVLIKAKPGTRIVIRSDQMFNSGSSVVSTAYQPLIQRIGEALETTTGPVRVEGHTDNVPFKSGLMTNQSLSTQRAQAISKGRRRRIYVFSIDI